MKATFAVTNTTWAVEKMRLKIREKFKPVLD